MCVQCRKPTGVNPHTGKPYAQCLQHRVKAANHYTQMGYGELRRQRRNEERDENLHTLPQAPREDQGALPQLSPGRDAAGLQGV